MSPRADPLGQSDVPWSVLRMSFEAPRPLSPGLSLDEWAGVVLAVEQQMAGAGAVLDAPLRLAARLAHERPGVAAAELLPARGDAGEVSRRSAATVAIVTHAALRGQPPGVARDLLELVEAGLLRPPPPSPLSAAVQHWCDVAVTARASLSHTWLAAAVAERQWQLLRVIDSRLSLVEAPETTGAALDRVRFRLGRAVDSWESVGQQLRETSTQSQPPADRDAAQSLRLASRQLSAALMGVAGAPAADLRTVLQVLPEANRAVAALLSTIHPQHVELATSARALTAATTVLLENSDWSTVTAAEPANNNLVQQPAAAPTPTPPTQARPFPAETATAPPTANPARVERESFDVPAGRISHEEAVELARRRDVGMIAQASLDGVPSAIALTGDAQSAELIWLARDGRMATAALVASATDIAGFHARGAPVEDRDDAFQQRMLALHKAATRWDPEIAQWATYAWSTARYLPPPAAADRKPVTLIDGDELDRLGTPLVGVATSPEEHALQAETLGMVHAAISELPPWQREAVTGILLREQTTTQLQQELGVTAPTILRRYRAGMERIRERIREMEQPAAQSAPPPHHLVEEAHLPRPDHRATASPDRAVTDPEIR